MARPPTQSAGELPARRLQRSSLLGLAFLLLALNLRPAIASISPLLGDVRRSEDLSPVVAGFLTTLPLVCFGALAFVAPRLVRRSGAGVVLLACLVALTAGNILRSVPGITPLFFGTFAIGGSIAIANVLMPGIVKKDFPNRIGLMTGLYTMALSAGPALAAGFSVPLAHAFGSWRLALAFWSLPAALATVAWFPFRRHDRPDPEAALPAATRRISLRDPVAWAVMVYMGIQSLVFYTILAWLPTILHSRGVPVEEAGYILAVANITGILAAFVSPVLAHRSRNQRAATVWSTLAFAVGIGGLLLDPRHLVYLWAVMIGIGQGSAVSLALMMMVVRARDIAQANALSGRAQGVGYLISALGPASAGALYSATHSWDAPLIMLLALLVPQLASGWWGGHGWVREPVA